LKTHSLGSLLVLVLALQLVSCNSKKKESAQTTPAASVIPSISFDVVATHAHDTTSFTEGLLMHNGKLYESTGSPLEMENTNSVVGIVDLQTGKIDAKVEINRAIFGEGITFLNNKLYQLTYEAKVGYIYNAETFKKIGEFPLPGKEGWGMTTDGTHLIMSDGTDKILYLDSVSLKPVKTLLVQDGNGSVKNVNELEYIKGYIYANVYTTNYIIKIDPATGRVQGRLDLSTLTRNARSQNRHALELNGIAYDSATGNVYVTGKFWPNTYAIRFSH
jgi:glutaminyl-peptide cyclotransferase